MQKPFARTATKNALQAVTQAGVGAHSFVPCVSYLINAHAPVSRRRTVFTPNGDTSIIWVLTTFVPHITNKPFEYLVPFLFRPLWPPSTSQDSDRFLDIFSYCTKRFHVTFVKIPHLSQ